MNEESQMIGKPIKKKCPISLVIREMEIKAKEDTTTRPSQNNFLF